MLYLISILLPALIQAGSPSFEILGATTPSAAARGTYFTYSIRVKREDRGDIRELVKHWKLKGRFVSKEGNELIPKEGAWGFPFQDRPGEGLLQFLFATDPYQQPGIYEFQGRLVDSETQIVLPIRTVEIGPFRP
jgi:hypothetical protein